MTNFRLFQEFADHNFKFDENGRKLSKWVENTEGKREIDPYEQFLFSHSVFKRLVSQGRQKVSLCGNGLMTFLVVFQLYCGSQCSYPCFLGVLLTSTLHKILL